MGKRLLVRTKAGDHLADSETEILQWLQDGHCECGDPLFLEESQKWVFVADLPRIAAMLEEKPKSKREKPVITVYQLGHGKQLQSGPFTLSTVLDMIQHGTLCAASWIFVEGDTEWRQVKAVKILRAALPALPKEVPSFEQLSAQEEISSADRLLGGLQLATGTHGASVADRKSDGNSTQRKILGLVEPEETSAPIVVPIPHGNPQVGTGLNFAPGFSDKFEDTGLHQNTETIGIEGLEDDEVTLSPENKESKVTLPPPIPTAPPSKAFYDATSDNEEISVRLDKASMDFNFPEDPVSEEAAGDDFKGALLPESPANLAAGLGNEGAQQLAAEGFFRADAKNSTQPSIPSISKIPPIPNVPKPPKPNAQGGQAAPVSPPRPTQLPEVQESLAVAGDLPSADEDQIPVDEQTKALSALGLSALEEDDALAVPPPPPTTVPQIQRPADEVEPPELDQSGPTIPRVTAPPKPQAKAPPTDDFDGITVEISPEPIWQIKHEGTGSLSGAVTFQEVIDMLRTGQLTREDKIGKVGTNRFAKISQQYEFNVNHSIETVIENGVERQKILIKRRHPRVAYITDAQIISHGRSFHAKCVNLSAGGILLEALELNVNLGDTVELHLMPGAIDRTIESTALVIGKIPKKPPGYALKFVNLAVEDKEAIQFYVMEALRREQAMGM